MPGFKISVSEGKVLIEAEGFKGSVCITETEKIISILKQLGIEIDVEEIQKKPEFYLSNEANKNEIGI